MKKLLLAAIFGSFLSTSCSVDEEAGIENPSLNVPETYTFERNGSSTVDYNGQTTRLVMVKELLSSFNDFDNATEQSLSNMFSNTNNPFSSEALNQSSKSIKSKVAASELYFAGNSVASSAIKNKFESFITAQVNEVFPNENEVASAGVAGQIADGSSVRYVNSKGLELNQAFAKGLIGALVADQMLNNYLSQAVLDAGDNIQKNNAGIVEEGKSYTTMEHKWDEAYGYLYGDPSIPGANPNAVLGESEDPLLFKYLGRVEKDSDFAGIAEETHQAFKKGRAAIVAGQYDVRDEQVEIIRENVSRILAIRAVYYLQAGKNAIEKEHWGTAFHALSEGYGFVYSLQFTHNPATNSPYVSAVEIEAIEEQLLAGNGFWDLDSQTLDAISEEIASRFDFTVAEAAE